jgi:hypothetical protein
VTAGEGSTRRRWSARRSSAAAMAAWVAGERHGEIVRSADRRRRARRGERTSWTWLLGGPEPLPIRYGPGRRLRLGWWVGRWTWKRAVGAAWQRLGRTSCSEEKFYRTSLNYCPNPLKKNYCPIYLSY